MGANERNWASYIQYSTVHYATHFRKHTGSCFVVWTQTNHGKKHNDDINQNENAKENTYNTKTHTEVSRTTVLYL